MTGKELINSEGIQGRIHAMEEFKNWRSQIVISKDGENLKS